MSQGEEKKSWLWPFAIQHQEKQMHNSGGAALVSIAHSLKEWLEFRETTANILFLSAS